ncbi:MAG: hypothetical protein AB1630_01270 [bacterium]
MRRNLVAIYIQTEDYENALKEAKDILAIFLQTLKHLSFLI